MGGDPNGGGFGGRMGGDPNAGGFGGRRMMMMGDPSRLFDMMSNGKDVIDRNSLQGWQQGMFDRFATSAGVTNGQMTRDQFQKAMSQFGGGRGGPGGGPGGGSDDRFSPENIDRMSEGRFRRLDRDGDGLLHVGEMDDSLRSVWEKYDLNKDGAISQDEYKSYFRDRMQQRMQENSTQNPSGPPSDPQQPGSFFPGMIPNITPPQEEERRPTVYRVGKLPKELPSWFEELDTDHDGQVGLYEWVQGGRSPADFKTMDRNDDGFLTVEEVLGYVRNLNKQQPNSPGVAVASNGMRGRFGGFGGGNGPQGWMGMSGPGGGGPVRMGVPVGGDFPGGGRGRGRGAEGQGGGPRFDIQGGDYNGAGRGRGRNRGDGQNGDFPNSGRSMRNRGGNE
jgi:Ca2+-binding EF-hand superfamily protein